MSLQQKKKVDGLIANNIAVSTVRRSGNLVLKQGKQFVTLASANGKLTKAGEYYFQKTGKEKPAGSFDTNQELVREKTMSTL